MKSWQKSPWVLVLPALVFFAAQIWNWHFIVDDAYISYRYAENLAQGQGLVFNPGEPPVEGYTNFLWTVLLSLAPILKLQFEVLSRLLGISFALGAAGFSALLVQLCLKKTSDSENKGLDQRWSGLAVALTLSNAGFILWAGAGLEPPLFALLLSASVYLVLKIFHSSNLSRGTIAGLLLALLSLCRPEAAALAALLALALLFQPKQSGAKWMNRLLPLMLFGIVTLMYQIWRIRYYGDLLPNTFYAKVGFSAEQVWRGMTYLADYFQVFGGWLWLIFTVFAWRAFPNRHSRALLLGIPLVALMGVIAVGGDALPMYRFIVPVVPLLAVVLTLGIAEAMTAFASSINKNSFRSPAIWVILIALLVSQALPAFVGHQAQYVMADQERMDDRVAIGKWLNGRYPGEAIAVNAAGAIPFYSGMKTIDMLGLNDRHIARSVKSEAGEGVAGHEKFDEEYVLSKRPAIIFIGRNELTIEPGGAYLWLQGDKRMLRHPWLQRDYRTVAVPIGFEYFSFYLRKDLPQP